MITVSGRVIFDRERTGAVSPNMQGIKNVTVVLQNVLSGKRLAVFTNGNGNYSFYNIHNGSYRVVEAFGEPAVNSPGNFDDAVIGPVPIGSMPPISFINNPPIGATNLDATTPNTLFITINCIDDDDKLKEIYLCSKCFNSKRKCKDIDNIDFLNGPVRYEPITAFEGTCSSISSANLINAADKGTFGTFPDGMAANSDANPNPYPSIAPDFTYVLPNPNKFTPNACEYTIQNLMNNSLSNRIGAWWRIADHTKGNETGRMMVVNGFDPGTVFFRDTISVKPNKDYLFSAWILNMFKVTGFANPALSVEILDEHNNVIFSEALGVLIPVNTAMPEWKQIGTIVNSLNNTLLTVQFLSEGPEAIGNDYAIDDICFSEIEITIDRCGAISDIIESVALQEAALSHILNAEGEKIQKAVVMNNLSNNEMLEINKSAAILLNNITRLEAILQAKLQLVSKECKFEI